MTQRNLQVILIAVIVFVGGALIVGFGYYSSVSTITVPPPLTSNSIDLFRDTINSMTTIGEPEVQRIVEQTIRMYESDKDSAFANINLLSENPVAHYPFVLDPDTKTIVAHGAFPDRVGSVSVALTKANIPFEKILSGLEDGPIWTEYVFVNPITQTDEHKISIFVMHDGYIFGSGYYVEQETIVEEIVGEAIALYNADPDGAFDQINAMLSADYRYPFVLDPDTKTIVAHGAFPDRVGSVSVALTEANIPFEKILSGLEDGPIWTEYVFVNPITQTDEHKISMFVMHDGYIFGSGYYVEQETIVEEIVGEAIALYNADPDGAFDQINAMLSADYRYPFVLDPDTKTIVAHGAFPDRVGSVSVALTEANIPFEKILSGLEDGPIWTEYVFVNPTTQTDEHKISMFVMHDGYIFGSGYYVEQELDRTPLE